MWCLLTWGKEKVKRRVDVVFDGAGLDGGSGDGIPLDEGDGIAGK